jgi:tetratricopeptide (TPR) repeat protein
MRVSRLCAAIGVGLALTGGIAGSSGAAEPDLAQAKARAKAQPMDAEAAIAHGRALRRAGQDAMTELRRAQAIAKGRTAIDADWEIARTFIAKRDFGAAMSACKSIAKRTGGIAASHVCAAEAHLLWRRGTEAQTELTAASGGSPIDAYFAKVAEGRVRELEAKDAEAEAAYREAVRLAPGRNEALVLLGAMLHRSGQDGIAPLKQATELEPNDPEAHYELGRALASRTESIAALERAIAIRPAYPEALRVLTDGYLAANRPADAKRTADALLRLSPNDVVAEIVVGRVALADGRPDDALRAGARALKLMPNDAKAKLLVADAYVKKGEIDLALEAYQSASGLDASDPTPLVNATYACLAAKRITSARAFAARAVKDFPNQASAWTAHGDALAADGNAKAARDAYESARRAKK